ncbi:MAG: HIT family protein [Parcubacteria group bacterium]|nr:HIT family protein [Parcubacteria group bacterium]MCR4342962.1 HIT family protein [Patescibacteria group bacterium]
MNDCIFCKIIKGEIPADKIYEDDNFLAFLDITPINLGHALLIPKNHYKDLFEIPDDTLCKIGPVIKKVAGAVKEGTKADGINIGMNNGRAAGQIVFHAHIHIMPRFSDDGYKLWHGKEYDKDTSKKTAKEIRKFI